MSKRALAYIREPVSRGFQRGIISGLETELAGGKAFISECTASVTRDGVGVALFLPSLCIRCMYLYLSILCRMALCIRYANLYSLRASISQHLGAQGPQYPRLPLALRPPRSLAPLRRSLSADT